MADQETITNLSELGEFALIDKLVKNVKIYNDSTLKAVGDDAAVIDHKDEQTLVSVDILCEGVHFDMTYCPLKHLGYKAAVVNFSDIYAMNGTPTQIVVGLGISSKYSVEAIEEIYRGIRLACDRYHVDLVGGDTTASKSGLFISITVIGKAKKEDIVYRNGAKPNDLLCVSGNLGAAYTGLLILEREKAAFMADPNMQPEFAGYDYILERQLKPEARRDIVEKLKEIKVKPTSMIDISDGLASEVLHLCKESKVGCMVYEDRIPMNQKTIQTAKDFNIVPSIAALNGGEDYELLFTIAQSDYEKVKDLDDVRSRGIPFAAGPAEVPYWERMMAEARTDAAEMGSSNAWGAENAFYTEQLAPALDSLAGARADETYQKSQEYGDLKCFLDVCDFCGIEPLIIIEPVMGPYYDHIGIGRETREAAYARIRDVVAAHPAARLCDFSDHEYEPGFLFDIVHFGWCGWVSCEHALWDFWQEG